MRCCSHRGRQSRPQPPVSRPVRESPPDLSSGSGSGNLPPVANNDSGFTTPENTVLSIPAASLLANDTDPNGFTLSILSVSNPVDGTVSYTGTHVVNLWNSAGTLLASATSSGETASGWQTVNLATPVTLTANTIYVASYHTGGFYSADSNYFAANHVSGSLTAPSSGGNGVYTYGSGSSFPTSSFNATNYWIDVLFSAGTGA